MTRTFKCGLIGLLAGALLAVWLIFLRGLLPIFIFENQLLVTILAPPTLFLKIDFVSPGLRLFILIVVIAQNALLYGLLGWIVGKIWSMLGPEPQAE